MIRRISWLTHNTIVTPLLPLRIVMVALICLGNLEEMALDRLPGWRRYDGWAFGWREPK